MESTKTARLTGFLYLLIVAGGVFAEAFVRSRLVAYNDPALTAQRILDSETLFRIGFFVEILVFMCDAAVAGLFYILLKPVNRNVSVVATVFRGITVAMLSINLLNNFIPLLLLKGSFLESFSAGEVQALALLFMKAHGTGYALALVFFSVHCVLLGYLLYQSTWLPRFFGFMMIVAGICYFVNSFVVFLLPALANVIFPAILLPPFVAELSLSVWLLVKGLKNKTVMA